MGKMFVVVRRGGRASLNFLGWHHFFILAGGGGVCLFIATCARTHLLGQGSRLGIELAIVVERLELTLEEREALNVHGGALVI